MTRISDPSDIIPVQPPPAPNGKMVLVAEDDPFISRMYETKLRSAGYAVMVTTNGRDAYEAIKSHHPDLLLLDLNLPELSGFEVLGALQSDHQDLSELPVIVLTNSSNPEDRRKATDYGVDYVIKAELTPRQVLEKINARLGLADPPANA